MNKYDAFLFLTQGFEEIEAVTTIDILRRADVNLLSVSLTGEEYVKGKNNIILKSDLVFSRINTDNAEMLILPGGNVLDGYKEHKDLATALKNHNNNNKRISAICAAPSFLGDLGILKGKTAVCYPGFEHKLEGATIGTNLVENSSNIITSKGPGTAILFALEIVKEIKGEETANEIKNSLIFD